MSAPAASRDRPCSPRRHGGAWQGRDIELGRARFNAFGLPHLVTGFVHHGGLEALGKGVTASWVAVGSTHSPAASGDGHMAAVKLNYCAYNFIRIHTTLRASPRMAAGVVTRLMDLSDLVKLLIQSAEQVA